MNNITHSALGIDPSSKVVGSSISNKTLLLRTRTIHGTTQRYVACYTSNGKFKYFRRVTSSERKRLGRGKNIMHPLEALKWSQGPTCWLAQCGKYHIVTLMPNNLLAPTDYSVYVVNGEMVSNNKLKEIISEMKITISDGTSTVTIENDLPMDSSMNRNILDVLFREEPEVQLNSVEPSVECRPITVPQNPVEFQTWLSTSDPRVTLNMLSTYTGHDLHNIENINNLVMRAPQVATRLGRSRFIQAAQWLHSQGRVENIPSVSSLRTYYNRAMRDS